MRPAITSLRGVLHGQKQTWLRPSSMVFEVVCKQTAECRRSPHRLPNEADTEGQMSSRSDFSPMLGIFMSSSLGSYFSPRRALCIAPAGCANSMPQRGLLLAFCSVTMTWFFLTFTPEASGTMSLSRLVLTNLWFCPSKPTTFRSKDASRAKRKQTNVAPLPTHA
uniref:Uncharacterized protein n=1 Tax=Alexandrium monilatum TaxID=311494 RepID=A0A7S4RWH0_9DINO